jgi:hypothetical protein
MAGDKSSGDSSRHGSQGKDSRKDSKHKSKSSKGKILGKVSDWVSTSEPSLQALKRYRSDTFHKAGISVNDPNANAKLHVPIGEIPSDAIKPTGRGPEPEEVALKKADMRRQMRSLQHPSGSRTSHSSSGERSDSQYSFKGNDPVFPFD